MTLLQPMPGSTQSQHVFSTLPKAEIPRSSFDLTHAFKQTFDSGYIVPVFLQEVLPGDTFNVKLNAFARLSPQALQVPIMDNLWLDTFFFFVPNRLVWNNWEKFNGAQDNPGDSTSYVIPQQVSPANGYAVNSLQDYFGLPTTPLPDVTKTITHSALPLRGYNLIFNTWFRDQNLQNSITVDKGDGPDNVANYVLRRRGKRHDYFTSALPWPQKGPAVTLPLGTSAPVMGIGPSGTVPISSSITIRDPSGNRVLANAAQFGTSSYYSLDSATGATAKSNIFADLSAATAATINQLRQAFQIQKLYERDARGGTRYTEIIQAHFGVVSDDARLQRPEYLGGGSTPIISHPVNQTSVVPSQATPLGQLAAVATASIRGHGFTRSFTEHGYVFGLANVRADLNYQQGLNRMWSRTTRVDFYWPALSHIGEQAVLNKEIYAGTTASDDLVFGYQERYAEYRYKPSEVRGLFRSTAAGTLDVWHLAEKYTALPTLSDSWIQSNPPVSRVLAVTNAPQILMDGFVEFKAARPMPVYSVPGYIDHF